VLPAAAAAAAALAALADDGVLAKRALLPGVEEEAAPPPPRMGVAVVVSRGVVGILSMLRLTAALLRVCGCRLAAALLALDPAAVIFGRRRWGCVGKQARAGFPERPCVCGVQCLE
jgi:hypothetical protein